jgi:hypothetical protein
MGAFFAAAVLRGRTPEPSQFFGAAFWIGFTLELIAAELWINYTRPSAAAQLAVYAAKILQQSSVGSVPTSKFVP